ncbi:GDSL esterase/lipase [Rhynchospora pubera]|uniref:GDSL esterase/lipase n=1 Tax=Rhynchospora pubera TaxID=906938 RepID=A0AAV8FRC4_9POAL|nr:GDSL esterase/lipase [Rhynchospora pubera]
MYVRLISNGAMHFVVPGNLPVGCSPMYLTLFATPNKKDYTKKNGCLKKLNKFAKYHNSLLQGELVKLQKKYPMTRIIYADYYGAAIPFTYSPKHFGFTHGALTTCCGGGGPYNFNPSARCGINGSRVCTNPSSYANWDGVHLTEAAYHAMAMSLLHGPNTIPPLL